MSNEDRIKENLNKGYILVKTLSNGLEVWKKKNPFNQWSYFGETCGIFDMIWDETIGSKEEFLAIAKDCYNLKCTNKKLI